jgi:orotate phosphoribosyltransferase
MFSSPQPYSAPHAAHAAVGGAYEAEFLQFAIRAGVLRFGSFVTKAGRHSPYFFNAGLFHHGGLLGALAAFYARAFLAAEAAGVWAADGLYGPAYKGIPLVSAAAIALAQQGRDIGFSFNRKEAKDHGEGGLIVGAPLRGRIVIVDDVISAGTSVRESVAMIREAGATPVGVLIALDRMERGGTAEKPSVTSAVQEVWGQFGIPVRAIASLDGLLAFLGQSQDPALSQYQQAVTDYRAQWGVTG